MTSWLTTTAGVLLQAAHVTLPHADRCWRSWFHVRSAETCSVTSPTVSADVSSSTAFFTFHHPDSWIMSWDLFHHRRSELWSDSSACLQTEREGNFKDDTNRSDRKKALCRGLLCLKCRVSINLSQWMCEQQELYWAWRPTWSARITAANWGERLNHIQNLKYVNRRPRTESTGPDFPS